jgi:hypothetical protein
VFQAIFIKQVVFVVFDLRFANHKIAKKKRMGKTVTRRNENTICLFTIEIIKKEMKCQKNECRGRRHNGNNTEIKTKVAEGKRASKY